MAQSSVPSGGLWDDVKAGMGNLGYWLGGVSSPAVRIGVTGLSRAGKTVFITSLVHALVSRTRLPAFEAQADGRIAEARLVEHPDDALPRFAYEDHLAMLTGPERDWPQSTRQISALSVQLAYQSQRGWLGGLIGAGQSALRLDIVDYPGEWLLDLPLLAKSYAEWSAETLAKARIGRREACFAPFLQHLAEPAGEASDEMRAKDLAVAFTSGLRACREEGRGLSALPPGRFLMPGDLEGAPALTFAPLPEGDGTPEFRALMERRYEAYKTRVVRPFFADHFARLDRQIVLVDVLGALNGGREAVADLELALTEVLTAFNAGANSLFSQIFSPRISRILFAATKADHLHHTNHDRLEAILALLVRRAWHRAQAAGATTATIAIAGIRATREVTATVKGEELPCIAGVPIAGEKLDARLFDGRSEIALFPGDLPKEPERIFAGEGGDLRFLRFRPPVIAPGAAMPYIRLDRALDFLVGDLVA